MNLPQIILGICGEVNAFHNRFDSAHLFLFANAFVYFRILNLIFSKLLFRRFKVYLLMFILSLFF